MNHLKNLQVVECSFATCASLFHRNKTNGSDRHIQLLMLGLDNSGKTCTAKSIVGESVLDVAPTIGFSKVTTKYKGFKVTIFDLGGSKSFRGIWPKYYHEVHGFIFVVDSSDLQRLDETAEVFAEIVANDKVQGKPLLMLCNKSDINDSKDEVHIVNALQVEKLVNASKCPTRVEPCVANKNQGLREGYKWLVRSVIANLDVLGPRVVKDVEDEKVFEAERQADIKKRVEEKRQNDPEADDNDDEGGDDSAPPPGFVPIEELREIWEKSQENVPAPQSPHASPVPQDEEVLDEVRENAEVVEESGPGPENEAVPEPRYYPTEPDIEEEKLSEVETEFTPEPFSVIQPPLPEPRKLSIDAIPAVVAEDLFLARQSSATSKLSSRRGSNQSSNSSSSRRGKVELEPIMKPKKTNVLKKMNSRSSIGSESGKPNSSKGSRKLK